MYIENYSTYSQVMKLHYHFASIVLCFAKYVLTYASFSYIVTESFFLLYFNT